jgi:NAD(P)-dependent dehydrogenase (short-subunit alcohol dehydrogenase family)
LIANKLGPIDILINNAGYISTGTVSDMDPDDSWTAFEIHVKGSIHVSQAFSRTKNPTESFVVETSSIVITVPPWPFAAAYTASKLAATKIWDFFRVENPSTRVISIQLGRIMTDMATKMGMEVEDPDDGE